MGFGVCLASPAISVLATFTAGPKFVSGASSPVAVEGCMHNQAPLVVVHKLPQDNVMNEMPCDTTFEAILKVICHH